MDAHKLWMLRDFIGTNKVLFRIPVYQRNYDWSESNCNRLLDDIYGIMQSGDKHFLGTIVFMAAKSGGFALQEYIIIDGQQRLTTLMLILKALSVVAGNRQISLRKSKPPVQRVVLIKEDAEMAKEKTTMSVSEMQHMLGLKKTDAYWLVHKHLFDTIIVEKKMRVVIASFEKWYANQLKRSKVNGPPPGAELRAYSISVKEMAELLGISDDTAYTIIKRDGIETFEVDYWKRIRKDVFEKWYKGQTKYRTVEDRERDKELEKTGYTEYAAPGRTT